MENFEMNCQNCKHYQQPVFFANREDDCFNTRFKRKPKCSILKRGFSDWSGINGEKFQEKTKA